MAYWSRTGLMDLVRAPDAPPAQSLPGMGDHPTAVALYGAIVTALMRRERTGRGSHVHTSLLANGLWAASCIAQAKLVESTFRRAAVVIVVGLVLLYVAALWLIRRYLHRRESPGAPPS